MNMIEKTRMRKLCREFCNDSVAIIECKLIQEGKCVLGYSKACYRATKKRSTKNKMAILRTMVVNLHAGSYMVYIGRGSKFGNPYIIGPDGSREDVIAKHKADFYNNPELQEAVWNELKSKTLGCFCSPQACHGDTYVEYIQNRMRKETK